MNAPTEGLQQLAKQACFHLAGMVVGSIQAGQMPPRSVFEWYIDYSTEVLIQMEREIIAAGPEAMADAEAGAALERSVVTIAELIRVCEANKLLVLKEKIMGALNARRLRLPPDFDATYGGLLSG